MKWTYSFTEQILTEGLQASHPVKGWGCGSLPSGSSQSVEKGGRHHPSKQIKIYLTRCGPGPKGQEQEHGAVIETEGVGKLGGGQQRPF